MSDTPKPSPIEISIHLDYSTGRLDYVISDNCNAMTAFGILETVKQMIWQKQLEKSKPTSSVLVRPPSGIARS